MARSVPDANGRWTLFILLPYTAAQKNTFTVRLTDPLGRQSAQLFLANQVEHSMASTADEITQAIQVGELKAFAFRHAAPGSRLVAPGRPATLSLSTTKAL